ncbi:hypothetical protein JG687_00018405, partial [Phytophthora cactorum]
PGSNLGCAWHPRSAFGRDRTRRRSVPKPRILRKTMPWRQGSLRVLISIEDEFQVSVSTLHVVFSLKRSYDPFALF